MKLINFGLSLLLIKSLFAETTSAEETKQPHLVPYHFEVASETDSPVDTKPRSNKKEDNEKISSKKKDKNSIVETGTVKAGAGTVEYTYVETKPDFFAECEAQWKQEKKDDSKKEDDNKDEEKKPGKKISVSWTKTWE